MADFEKTPVKCPVCKAIAFHHNGKTKMPVVAKCEQCGQRIVYYPETKEVTKSKANSERVSSSGKRF